jgi:hypothetical protein
MTTLRWKRDQSTDESNGDKSDKENASPASSATSSHTVKRHRKNCKGSSDSKEVISLLQEDIQRRAGFEDRMEKVLTKAMEEAQADHQEFMAFLKESH